MGRDHAESPVVELVVLDDDADSLVAAAQPPREARRRERHPLTVLLWTGVAAAGFAMAVNPRAYVLLAAIVAVAAAGLLLPSLIVWGVRGEIHYLQKRGAVGKRVVARLRLHNRWPWPVWGVVVRGGWRETLQAPSADPAVLAIGRLPGRRPVEVSWAITPQRRGRYPLGAATLECAFPFGFRRAKRRISTVGEVIVWPRLVDLRQAAQPGAGSDLLSEMTDGRRPGLVGDVLGARPYQPGDSLRRVHWRQTARHDRLVVCEFGSARGMEVELVLETAPEFHPIEDGARATLEAAISIAASLAKALVAAGSHVRLRLGPAAAIQADQAGQLPGVLDVLATVAPCSTGRLSTIAGVARTTDGHGSVRWVITTAAGLASIRLAEGVSPWTRFLVVDRSGQIVLYGPAAAGREKGGARRPAIGAGKPLRLDDAWGELIHAC